MSHNNIKEMQEIQRLNELPSLRTLVLVGNPVEETLSADDKWRETVAKALPRITKLDGVVVLRSGE